MRLHKLYTSSLIYQFVKTGFSTQQTALVFTKLVFFFQNSHFEKLFLHQTFHSFFVPLKTNTQKERTQSSLFFTVFLIRLLHIHSLYLISYFHQVTSCIRNRHAEISIRYAPLVHNSSLHIKECIRRSNTGSSNLDISTNNR